MHDMSPLARAIKRRLDATGMAATALASSVGLNPTALHDIFSGKSRNPRSDTIDKIAAGLGCTAADLHHEAADFVGGSSRRQGSSTPAPTMLPIDELDIRASAGPGSLSDGNLVVETWQIPRDFLRARTSAPVARLKIVSIHGSSMEPTLVSGQRVLVDTGDTVPEPPGIMIVWTGLAQVCKRVRVVKATAPAIVRISSDNPVHAGDDYECPLEDVLIQGRVIGAWLWL